MKAKRSKRSETRNENESWEEAHAHDLKILDEHAEQFNAEAEDTLSYQNSE
jgi:hypothetical protein